MCRLAFTVATDAPISQAKMVASIASVEWQVRAIAKQNSEMQQQLEEKLDVQALPAQTGDDSAPLQTTAKDVRASILFLTLLLIHAILVSAVHYQLSAQECLARLDAVGPSLISSGQSYTQAM